MPVAQQRASLTATATATATVTDRGCRLKSPPQVPILTNITIAMRVNDQGAVDGAPGIPRRH